MNSGIYNIAFFYQIFMNVHNNTNINSILINKKIVHFSIQSAFFMLPTVKSF